MELWGQGAVERLRYGLNWDFAFIPSYVLGLVLLTGFVANSITSLAPAWSRLGVALGYGVLLAGALDVIENLALLRVLAPDPGVMWAPVAGVASALKWGILLITGLYLIMAGIRSLRRY